MRRNSYVYFLVLLVLSSFLLSGCGGGGGGHSFNTENNGQDQQQQQEDDSPSTDEPAPTPEEPVQEPEQDTTPDDNAHYDPYPFTQEELIGLARSVVPGISFDKSLLEDDNSASAQYVYAAAELSDEAKAKRARKIVTAMWKHAVKLAVFPDSVTVPYKLQVPYNPDMKLQNTATTHKSISQAGTQKRYLYVYPSYGERTTLERFPYTQWKGSNSVYSWNSNGCPDEIMGTDCVGFVYHCVYDATKDYEVDDVVVAGVKQKGARMRFGATADGLGNPETWKGTGLFPNAKRITDKSQPPKPGDILIWDGHVGMAVRIDYNTIGVAHSTGKTSGPYTCTEYSNYAKEDVAWVGYPSERNYSGENGVNGFVVHEYNNYIKKFAPGKRVELYRVRLEETERIDEYDGDAVAAKLNGTWKPVDVNAYMTEYNAYGLPVYENSSKFVKYNPDDPENSSSLVITISVDKRLPETDYQSLKPEYLISADGQIVFASLANEASISRDTSPGATGFFDEGYSYSSTGRIDSNNNVYSASIMTDLFCYTAFDKDVYVFQVSGDVLVFERDQTDWSSKPKRTITISFPDSSKMRIVNSYRDRENVQYYGFYGRVSADLIIELERTDGKEEPEPDEWLKKLSGAWDPVEYNYSDGNTEKAFTVVPYNPDDPAFSSDQIEIKPYRKYYWYELGWPSSTVVYLDDNSLPIWHNNGPEVFNLYTGIYGGVYPYPPLEVSGDALIGEAAFLENVYPKHVHIEFPDTDTMTVENSYDDNVYHYFKLKRKK
ncbi:MAG: hypothetical protein IJT58_00090 [Synergistaceae bacterium]|nr:hypothetical protein [Synergistaceae bacterium]